MNATKVLRAIALALAAWFVALLVYVFARRFVYPYDLEWMEGGMLAHALRLADGQPLYAPPSVDFIPYLYTPGYPARRRRARQNLRHRLRARPLRLARRLLRRRRPRLHLRAPRRRLARRRRLRHRHHLRRLRPDGLVLRSGAPRFALHGPGDRGPARRLVEAQVVRRRRRRGAHPRRCVLRQADGGAVHDRARPRPLARLAARRRRLRPHARRRRAARAVDLEPRLGRLVLDLHQRAPSQARLLPGARVSRHARPPRAHPRPRRSCSCRGRSSAAARRGWSTPRFIALAGIGAACTSFGTQWAFTNAFMPGVMLPAIAIGVAAGRLVDDPRGAPPRLRPAAVYLLLALSILTRAGRPRSPSPGA